MKTPVQALHLLSTPGTRFGHAALAVTLIAASLGAPVRPARASSGEASCVPGSGSATLSGGVTTSTATPAPNVLVTAYTAYGHRAGYDYTDAAGAYQIENVIGGAYLLEFRPSSGGDRIEWLYDQPGPTTATTVTVPTGGATTGLDAQLNPGSQIRGRVTGVGGAGLASVRVDVYDARGQSVASAYTDATGAYTTAPGLASGAYRLGYSQAHTYVSEYFTDAVELDTADPVTVTSPALLDGIDVQLEPGGTITGVVTSVATGLPLPSISVYASGAAGSDFGFTDGDGQYVLTGLGTGSYEVSANPTFGENLIATPQTVAVTAPGATTNVDFSMSVGGTITGLVTGPGGAPLNNITVYIGGVGVDYGDYFSTNASGVYTATGLPTGDYVVFFRPHATYVPEAYNDKEFETDSRDLVSVTAPNVVGGIDAELAPGSRIGGRVTAADTGAPIEGVFVEILDLAGRRIETDFTDVNGVYETPATLASGTYKVIFNADARNGSCAFVSAFYGGGDELETAATVPVGSSAVVGGIDAALVRGSIVFGFVTAEDTGAPITYGGVDIYDAAGDNAAFGRLTFLGGYLTTALPSGDYRAFFHDNGEGGYVDEYYNDQATLALAEPFALTAPTDLHGINAQLARGGLLSGRVTVASTGLPFTGGYVEVIDSAGEVRGYGELNADGTYTVTDGLASGAYRVAAVPYTGGEGGGLLTPFIPSFYRGTTMPAAPLWVPVTAPGTVADIDIAILNGAFLPHISR